MTMFQYRKFNFVIGHWQEGKCLNPNDRWPLTNDSGEAG